jgi:hypothetical protein
MSNTDGARSSALRFTDDVGMPGHVHPGYVRHFVTSDAPPLPAVGDMWSTGSLLEHRYMSVTGYVAGAVVDEFPDFASEPNPFYPTVMLGQYPSEKAILSIGVGVAETVDLSTPIPITVQAGAHTWSWTFNRLEDQTVQVTSYEVIDPLQLAALVGQVTFTVTLNAAFVTSLSVVDFVVATAQTAVATSWWDGTDWMALSGSDQSVQEVFIGVNNPDPDAGIKLFVDVDDEAGLFDTSHYPRVFIQLQDPATYPPAGRQVQDGDIWMAL